MWDAKIYWPIILSICLLTQCTLPTSAAPSQANNSEPVETKQTPLTPSQFSLAATRFIVMLPFLPLLLVVPGFTAVAMPLFMALQDRLRTIIPNLPTRLPGGSTSTGSISNTVSDSGSLPTKFLMKRSLFKLPRRPLFKLPTKIVHEGFKDVFELLHKTDDVLNQLTSTQPDCRRQAVCRLHHSIDPDVGSFLGNALRVLQWESSIEKLDLSDSTRSFVKEVLKAANTGLTQRDCNTVYSHCSITVHNRRP